MQAWTIVPIRGLASGKTRLAPALDASGRLQLCTRMLLGTLDAVHATFGSLDRCIVVSADAAARSLAQARGARTLCDPPGAGLDRALDAARELARGEGATQLLLLSADLPDIDPPALLSLLASGARAAPVLLADKCGTGTNGMLLPAGLPLRFAFGPGSLQRHRAALAALGVEAASSNDPRLAFDIDTPADLDAWLLRTAQGARTSAMRSPGPAPCGRPAVRSRAP
jgi:2-phospho-L-lactate/phosphoenolpyruvate guanylyltransferase